MPKLYFHVIGAKKDIWVWELVDDNGRVVSRSKSSFRHYLEALGNAHKNGIELKPSFRPITHWTQHSEKSVDR